MKSTEKIHDAKSPLPENHHKVGTSEAGPPRVKAGQSTNCEPGNSASLVGQPPEEHNASAVPLLAQPMHEEIARLAYKRFMARGQGAGQAEEDWFMAELELRSAMDLSDSRTITRTG